MDSRFAQALRATLRPTKPVATAAGLLLTFIPVAILIAGFVAGFGLVGVLAALLTVFVVLFVLAFLALMRAQAAARDDLSAAALLISTELRDIKRKIELVRSTRPHPHYSLGFRLPAARWDEYKELLAKSGSLYGTVEAAYVAAHEVNERLAMRETRSGNPSQILGVIDEDGLDGAYDAAGVALAAFAPLTGATP